MEPISIITLVAAVIGAINAGSHLISGIWKRLKSSFGSTLRSQSALQSLDRGRLQGALTNIFQDNQGLRSRANARYVVVGADGDNSDFSDF
ncbi:hypothetical protein LTR17_009242 [Elasticomyces elasticus]|nr:hypothetical protein LTR17_009242 [Elasticomyces elasticus]